MEKIKDFFLKNSYFRNILAVILGCIIGGIANGMIVEYGTLLIPYPEGYNHSTPALFKSTFHLLQPKHFVIPFLAHAIGTLIASFLVCILAYSLQKKLAIVVAVFFFFGGLSMIWMIYPLSPMWFNILDLVGAYFPMAWLGYKLGFKNRI